MRTKYDVLIVGGGPAGSTAALALRKYAPDISVAVIDSERFPRDKACGDGLGPGVREVLADLDALAVVDDALSPPAVRVGGPGGLEGYAEGPKVRGKDLSGWVVPRRVFDDRLLRLAEARGIEVLEEHKFLASVLVDSGRDVRVQHHNSIETVRVGLLVGADGAYSRVRRDFGVEKATKATTHIAMRAYATIATGSALPSASSMRIDFEEPLLPAYGWVFPISESAANIGVGLPLTTFEARKTNLRSLLAQYVDGLKARGVEVEQYSDTRSHLLPHTAGMPRLNYEHGALIGDAASMINPLSGEGISYGMEAGRLLAISFQNVKSLENLAGRPDDFDRRFRHRYRLHFLSCLTGHKLLQNPTWARMVIKATARDQSVMDDAAFLLFNDGIIRPSTGFRILRSGF